MTNSAEDWREHFHARRNSPIVPATPDWYEARAEPAEQPEQPEAAATGRTKRAGATAPGGGIDPAAGNEPNPFRSVEDARRHFRSRRNGPPVVNAIEQR